MLKIFLCCFSLSYLSSCISFNCIILILASQLWQAFVGVKARRVETYYQDLLALGTKPGNNAEDKSTVSKGNGSCVDPSIDTACLPENWRGQIEKVTEHATLFLIFPVCYLSTPFSSNHNILCSCWVSIHFGFNLALLF